MIVKIVITAVFIISIAGLAWLATIVFINLKNSK